LPGSAFVAKKISIDATRSVTNPSAMRRTRNVRIGRRARRLAIAAGGSGALSGSSAATNAILVLMFAYTDSLRQR
jgi:hypothetical protein